MEQEGFYSNTSWRIYYPRYWNLGEKLAKCLLFDPFLLSNGEQLSWLKRRQMPSDSLSFSESSKPLLLKARDLLASRSLFACLMLAFCLFFGRKKLRGLKRRNIEVKKTPKQEFLTKKRASGKVHAKPTNKAKFFFDSIFKVHWKLANKNTNSRFK